LLIRFSSHKLGPNLFPKHIQSGHKRWSLPLIVTKTLDPFTRHLRPLKAEDPAPHPRAEIIDAAPAAQAPYAHGIKDFFMPAEWAQHQQCWMGWPCRLATFGGDLTQAYSAYAAVANAIAEFEPVTMLVPPHDVQQARRYLSSGVTIAEAALSDSWLRDTAPCFVMDAGGRHLAGVDWGFNAWGGNYPLAQCAADAGLAAWILGRMGIARFAPPLIAEGGAFCVDGEGTALTTSDVMLNPNRNPHLSPAEIAASVKTALGVQELVWLPGSYEQDETDGHVDEVACFVKPGQVVHLAAHLDEDPVNAARFAANIGLLRQSTDAKGRSFEVVTVKGPPPRYHHGVRLTLSYINFYIANGAIIMPAFGALEDAAAKAQLAELFAGRQIIQLSAEASLAIVGGGGGIHCITQQQPALLGGREL
jgi:agmatine deiminase